MSGARACLGCSSALARFAIQSHARRGPAHVHHRGFFASAAVALPRSPSSRGPSPPPTRAAQRRALRGSHRQHLPLEHAV